MKKNRISKYIAAIAVGGSLVFGGCTDNFEEINTNPYTITPEELEADFQHIGAPFMQAQQNLYSFTPAWVTQLQQNLIGDVYGGYMMPPTPFASNSNNMTYKLVDGWNGFPWNTAYQNVMAPMAKADFAAGEGTEFENFKAWSKILRVEAMHRVSDIYGPIVYKNFGQSGALYESQEAVYTAFFADLDAAITTLTPLIASETRPFTEFDLVYGGDYAKWVKFANSLRLRLAIRISGVNPAEAKKQGEAAMSHSAGLMTTNADNFIVANSSGADHPLNVMNLAWGDVRMSAEMESILVGYKDSRIANYFSTSTIVEDQYKGIRQGIEIVAKSDYGVFSPLAEFEPTIQLMTASEVHFLMAEAALKGWTVAGDAMTHYTMGVTTSFDQHGAKGATDYLADATSTPIDYVDAFNASNNIASSITISPAWDAAASNEENLERIITQKWIAMYPDGQEAWSEFRRTGYPKLFPVVLNFSGGQISTEEQIKRINFPASEKDGNPTGVAEGVKQLGGEDHGGTNLWWDVN
jgi:hypothetical protein